MTEIEIAIGRAFYFGWLGLGILALIATLVLWLRGKL